MNDHHLLSALLSYTVPEQDTKSISVSLLNHYENLSKLVVAPTQELVDTFNLTVDTANLFKLVFHSARKLKLSPIHNKSLKSPEAVRDYCLVSFSNLEEERAYILLLNNKCCLIREELINIGESGFVSISMKEIVKACLDSSAYGVILIHNHPSGSPTPSQEDLDLTCRLRELLKLLNIKLEDHIIVGKNIIYSFNEDRFI